MTSVDLRVALRDLCLQLEGDELAVLAEVARGLVLGRGVYGVLELATDPRNFPAEASSEARDLAVYLAAEVVRRRLARTAVAMDAMDLRLRDALVGVVD